MGLVKIGKFDRLHIHYLRVEYFSFIKTNKECTHNITLKNGFAHFTADFLSHLLNDLVQAVMVSIYPMLKENYQLSFAQIGMISLIYQITASIIQPGIGLYTDTQNRIYCPSVC